VPVLFGRRVIVELGVAGGTARRFEGLRVSFTVEMDDASTPNKAKIETYGVSRDTVALMQEEGALIRLLAGYESTTGARLLFEGNPIAGGVKLDRRQGTERVLVVEAQDGGSVYRTSAISETYATATHSGALFTACAQAMGVPLGNVGAVVGSVSFPHGYTLTGPVRKHLDRIAEMSGAKWQIRDGALQVWAVGGTTGEEAVVISAAAGNLIGSPKPQDGGGIEVQALLAPTLRPGKAFRVESEDYRGNYAATKVVFTGDSGFDRPFYAVAKGTAL